MLKKNGVFYFERFLESPQLVHGFSTRQFGNMRPNNDSSQKSREMFLNVLHQNSSNLVQMNQVHGKGVKWVSNKDQGTVVASTDALVTDKDTIFLSVITADCVPVLLYDPKKEHIGIIHAGWRGVYKEIIQEVIRQMIEKGSDPRDLMIGIGPSIRVCCYEVDKGHAYSFVAKFGQDDFVRRESDQVFLDLPLLVKCQLQSMGVRNENIEDGGICTAENLEDFYSYRREGKIFGEFMGVIGRK